MGKTFDSPPPKKLPAIFRNTITVPTKLYLKEPCDLEKQFYKVMIADLIYKRHAMNMTQEELNTRLGVTDGQVNKWEAGVRLPSSFNLMCWANALGMQIRLVRIDG